MYRHSIRAETRKTIKIVSNLQTLHHPATLIPSISNECVIKAYRNTNTHIHHITYTVHPIPPTLNTQNRTHHHPQFQRILIF